MNSITSSVEPNRPPYISTEPLSISNALDGRACPWALYDAIDEATKRRRGTIVVMVVSLRIGFPSQFFGRVLQLLTIVEDWQFASRLI